MIETEQRLHRAADVMAVHAKHSVSDVQRNAAFASAVKRGLVLSDEQKAAFEHVTKKDGLSVVVGYAGTGKSAMLGVAREAWESRSEEHTSELQSIMRISYAVFCLQKK